MFDINRATESVRMYEPLVKLAQKNILVIGTDHGQSPFPFPGANQTQDEIDKVFGNNLNALAMDSQRPLDFQYNLDLIDSIEKQRPEVDSFVQWPLRQAQSKGIFLIATDIISHKPSWVKVLGDENRENLLEAQVYAEDYRNGELNEENRQQEMVNIQKRFLRAALTLGVANAIRLMRIQINNHREAGIALTPSERSILSRRKFIEATLGFTATTYLFSEALGSTSSQQTDFEKDTINPYNARLELANVGSRPHELTAEDYNNPYLEYRKKRIYPLIQGAILRHAIAAEILDAVPPGLLLPPGSTEEKVNIATVWGYDHLIVPPQNTISEFLNNPQRRKEFISTELSNLFTGLVKKGLSPQQIAQFKQDLFDLPRVFNIDSQKKVTTKRFLVPLLTKILSQF